MTNLLHVVPDGEEALAFLRHEPPYDDKKPLDFQRFVKAVRHSDLYWRLCSLP